MPALSNAPAIFDRANDVSELVVAVRACLARADRLALPMVAIHLEQARAWLIEHGHYDATFPNDIAADPRPARS